MEQKVYDLFDKLDIKYEIIKHPPVFGASDREILLLILKVRLVVKIY